MRNRYSGYIPEHMQRATAEGQADNLLNRLHGDNGIPLDFGEVCGALIETLRIVMNVNDQLSERITLLERGRANE